jgi:hypothetical protein
MAFINAIGTTKALSKAIPTVKTNGKVKSWDLTVVYSCNGLIKDFGCGADVEYLDKEPSDFTKAELLGFCNTVHLDMVFDSFYGSMTGTPTEEKVNDFDITSLS